MGTVYYLADRLAYRRGRFWATCKRELLLTVVMSVEAVTCGAAFVVLSSVLLAIIEGV